MVELQNHLNAYKPNSVVVIEQEHGDVVTVPPGWVHQVVTRQPCLKVALDKYLPDNYGVYALLMRTITSPVFGRAMSPDYMAICEIVGKELLAMNL